MSENLMSTIDCASTFPASIGQEELWLLDRKDSGALALHLEGVVYIDGPLRVDLLERAAREVHALRDDVRMVFDWQDGTGLCARIADSQPAAWEYVDLEGLPEPERQAAHRASRYRTLEAPYDFQEGPLVRLCLQRFAPNRHLLIGVFHHLVCDGSSTL